MILTLDIGNTNITLATFDGDTLTFASRISTMPESTSDELALRLVGILELYGISRASITGVAVASVVPQLNDAVCAAVRFAFGADALVVGPGIKSGIGIHCDMPSSVGADIIASVVAVHGLYGSPALIVDLGTATKLTVVDSKGAFIGTSIAPGVRMGLWALAERTAQLPSIGLSRPESVIAKNTADCMRSGVLYGHAAMVDGMIDRICEEYGRRLDTYATGGMAGTVIPLCTHTVTLDEYLVPKGLNILYHRNRQ